MGNSFRNNILRLFVLTAAILVVVGVVVYRSIRGFVADTDRVAHTYRVLETLSDTFAALKDAESGQRGYVITGQDVYLKPFYASLMRIEDNLEQLRQLTHDTPDQQRRIPLLEKRIKTRLIMAHTVVALRQRKGFEVARRLMLVGSGQREMEAVRALIAEMTRDERQLLQQRREMAEASAQSALLIGGSGIVLSVATLLVMFLIIRHESAQREVGLEESNARLQIWVREMERLTREMRLLNHMGELLQSCRSREEAHAVVVRMVPQLLPDESGALCLLNESQNLLETVLTWGTGPPPQTLFGPDDCWALRRGRMHMVQDVHSGLICRHLREEIAGGYMCMPMVAHGETLGILYISTPRAGDLSEVKQQAIRSVTEQVSLTLANLRLQDTLRTQSIRDPLSGLFNRRYMEASLERELTRAKRSRHPVSVLMIDIDHFKRFNDTYGHGAGDAVLRELGNLLQSHTRGEDIACRYGGEEFLLILPETSLTTAQQRAEQLREAAKRLHVEYRRQPLEPVTLSLGVAVYPDHGTSGEEVTRAADTALYQAKREGRDRVATAGQPPQSLASYAAAAS
ncbi:MAG: diguanylate cyclase [Armatimonadota bacterium]|nr:diguanylate cyclase [Armatimonadota bacterium]